MPASNLDLVSRFFEAYGKHDVTGIRKVMADDVIWTFSGEHPLAGVKKGVQEVVAFFDTMGGIMGTSKPTIEKLVVAENGDYVVECSHIKTHREDGINIDHQVCVLWRIENGKIVEGRHFFADPKGVNDYFTAVMAADGT